jgi:hypothetical protein
VGYRSSVCQHVFSGLKSLDAPEPSGKGVATGGPKEGYAGHYHVRYFNEDGSFSDEYDLVIEKTGNFYNASWITNGKVSASSVTHK